MFNKIRITRTWQIALVGVLFLTFTAFSQQLIQPEDREISLQGTVRLMHGFGPPGYGEDPKHDLHLTYWVLDLSIPINTPCTPTKPEYATDECAPAKRLKLFFNDMPLAKVTELPAAKWKDHEVTVKGKLHRADTAGEMTNIYIDVQRIQGLTSTTTPSR